jgi:hypothetical protein
LQLTSLSSSTPSGLSSTASAAPSSVKAMSMLTSSLLWLRRLRRHRPRLPSSASTTSALTLSHPGLCQLRLATLGGSPPRTQHRLGLEITSPLCAETRA